MASVEASYFKRTQYFELRQPVHRLTRFLHFIGLWPNGSERWKCFYTAYAVVFQLIFTVAYDTFKCMSFLQPIDLNVITRAMFICLTELSLAVKIANFGIRMSTMQQLLADIEHGIRARDERERQTYASALTFLSNVIMWFFVTANTTGIFSYVSPMLMTERMLPYPGWYPWLNWQQSHRDYWLVWLYQVMGMFFQIQMLVIIEVYFIYLMVIASAQLQLLGDRMERIEVGIGNADADAERELCECMRLHQRIMKFVSSIEKCGSIPYFVQFILSGIVLCVAVFQIAIMNPSDAIAEFVFYVGFVMTMLTQIFLPCYYGNDIVLKSGQLTKAVYMSNWTDCSMRYRRLVIVYMELMKRPRKLVVGQLFTLTLDSFLLVLNRAYSMYALVQSFVE